MQPAHGGRACGVGRALLACHASVRCFRSAGVMSGWDSLPRPTGQACRQTSRHTQHKRCVRAPRRSQPVVDCTGDRVAELVPVVDEAILDVVGLVLLHFVLPLSKREGPSAHAG